MKATATVVESRAVKTKQQTHYEIWSWGDNSEKWSFTIDAETLPEIHEYAKDYSCPIHIVKIVLPGGGGKAITTK